MITIGYRNIDHLTVLHFFLKVERKNSALSQGNIAAVGKKPLWLLLNYVKNHHTKYLTPLTYFICYFLRQFLTISKATVKE